MKIKFEGDDRASDSASDQSRRYLLHCLVHETDINVVIYHLKCL